jgi:hypothetical protein
MSEPSYVRPQVFPAFPRMMRWLLIAVGPTVVALLIVLALGCASGQGTRDFMDMARKACHPNAVASVDLDHHRFQCEDSPLH